MIIASKSSVSAKNTNTKIKTKINTNANKNTNAKINTNANKNTNANANKNTNANTKINTINKSIIVINDPMKNFDELFDEFYNRYPCVPYRRLV